MARFSDLSENDRIDRTKTAFIVLVGKIARDPSKLREYLQIGKQRKAVEPKTLKVEDNMSREELAALAVVNNAALEEARNVNQKLKEEEQKEEELLKKAELAISKFERNVGCICNSCFNMNSLNNIVPPELEPLIEIALKQVKEQTY